MICLSEVAMYQSSLKRFASTPTHIYNTVYILYYFYVISFLKGNYIINYIYIDWYGFIHFSHWNIHHMINALFGNFSILFRYIPTNSGAIFRWSTKIGFDDYIEKVVVVFTTKFLRPYFVSCAKNFRFMIFPRPIH